MARILIVEDDRLLMEGIRFVLEREGEQVICADSIRQMQRALKEQLELVLLDVSLPDGDSREYLADLREENAVPVIFLTARNTEQDMIAGFDAGADDYITKPFSVPLLLRRIRAVLGRTREQERTLYRSAGLTYDFSMKIMKRDGKEIPLTPTELKILEVFLANRNRVLTREMLLECVWDIDGNFVDEKALAVNISRMREKLETDPKKPDRIKTVFGIGYKWEDL